MGNPKRRRSIYPALRNQQYGGIVAFTGGQSYLYANGKFKLINIPNSVMTEVDGMAPGGLISGRTAYLYGFTATCQ